MRRSTDELPATAEALRPYFRRTLAAFRIPPAEGEDLVQETLLCALGQWNDLHAPLRWLAVTFRNRCIIYWRRRRKTAERFEPLPEDPEVLGPAIAREGGQSLAAVRLDLSRLLESLSPRYRRLLYLRYGWRLEPLAIGDELGLARTSIRKLATRSLARVRNSRRLSEPPL